MWVFLEGLFWGLFLSGVFCVYLLIGGSVPSDVKYVWSVVRSIPLAGCTALFLWVFLRGGGVLMVFLEGLFWGLFYLFVFCLFLFFVRVICFLFIVFFGE